MTVTKNRNRSIRQLHRALAPIMLAPLLLSAITGSIFEVYDLAGKEHSGHWLMELHKGHFGPLHLEVIYPFLNALGLVVLVISGISMWLNLRANRRLSD